MTSRKKNKEMSQQFDKAQSMLQVPFRYTTMSQTTTAPTIVVQTMTTGAVYDLSQSIKQAWNKGMKRNPSGGDPGGNPGGGGGG